jgi:hypothetical protein
MSILLSWFGIIVLGFFLVFSLATSRAGTDCLSRDLDGCGDVIDEHGIPDPDSAAFGWTPVTVNGIPGVIAPASAAGDFLATADGYWTPDLTDVEAAEAALFADQGELAHFRQYAGIEQDGQRKILINGFCDSMNLNWYRSPMIVMDGGDCFFNAEYDVETDEIESFYFNGDA